MLQAIGRYWKVKLGEGHGERFGDRAKFHMPLHTCRLRPAYFYSQAGTVLTGNDVSSTQCTLDTVPLLQKPK